LQYPFAIHIDSIQEASCFSTLQNSALRKECFKSSKLVWDPGIILSFSLVHPVDRKVVMALLDDKKYLGREECNVPICGFSFSTIEDDFLGFCQFNQRGNLMLLVDSKGLEDLYDAQRAYFVIFHHQDHSYIVIFQF